MTAKLDTKVWKDKSISIISFPIEDIGPEKFNLKNPASKEVVKELLDLRIEEEKLSNGHYNTRVIVGSGSGTLVVGLVLCILGKLLCKKCIGQTKGCLKVSELICLELYYSNSNKINMW